MRKFFKINILRRLLCQCVHHCNFPQFCVSRIYNFAHGILRQIAALPLGRSSHPWPQSCREVLGRKWELKHTPDMEHMAGSAWVLRGPSAGSGLAAARSSGSSSFFSPMCTQQYLLVVLVLFGGVTFWIHLF